MKKILLLLIILLLVVGCNVVRESENVKKINILVNNYNLIVQLENNSSADALYERLEKESIIIDAEDYGNFEKVGNLGFNLPTNDKRITTKPGDIILYQGDKLTIYYDSNTWSFTKLGEVVNVTDSELKSILGSGSVTLTLEKIR